MIKGISGYGYRDELVIPIIENTSKEYELTASLDQAVLKYPKSVAVLVRDHGVYVWGNSWEDAKRHGECLHYLFELSLKLCHLEKCMGQTISTEVEVVQDGNPRKRHRPLDQAGNGQIVSADTSHYKHVLLDIEGTTTPITFVKDVLFPYARDQVENYLRKHWYGDAQSDLIALLHQHAADKNDGSLLSLSALSKLSLKSERLLFTESLLIAFTTYVQWNIEKDRKIKALKDLQGKIWKDGYDSGALNAIVYDDVPLFLKRMKHLGKNVCIYSSGSRSAQKLLFKHSNHGDLREYLSCYFDTVVGHKRDASSYNEISLYLGVDKASEILFVTDIFEEAVAATEAGMSAMISIRPGNAPLLHDQINFCKCITSFDEI